MDGANSGNGLGGDVSNVAWAGSVTRKWIKISRNGSQHEPIAAAFVDDAVIRRLYCRARREKTPEKGTPPGRTIA